MRDELRSPSYWAAVLREEELERLARVAAEEASAAGAAVAEEPSVEPPAEIRGKYTLKERDSWINALLASNETETIKCVGIKVAMYLNFGTGQCNPSYVTIANALGGMSERTVQRAVKSLESGGWLRVVRTLGGRREGFLGNTNSFALRLPR